MGQTPAVISKDVIDKTSNGIERVYTDGTKVVEKAYSIAEQTSPKIEKALKSLGSSLQVTANRVWDILVKQQLVLSIGYLVLFLTTMFCWCHFWFRYEQGRKNQWGDGSYELACIITFALAVTGTIVNVYTFNSILMGFINPEFGAMKTIIEIAAQIK